MIRSGAGGHECEQICTEREDRDNQKDDKDADKIKERRDEMSQERERTKDDGKNKDNPFLKPRTGTPTNSHARTSRTSWGQWRTSTAGLGVRGRDGIWTQ